MKAKSIPIVLLVLLLTLVSTSCGNGKVQTYGQLVLANQNGQHENMTVAKLPEGSPILVIKLLSPIESDDEYTGVVKFVFKTGFRPRTNITIDGCKASFRYINIITGKADDLTEVDFNPNGDNGCFSYNGKAVGFKGVRIGYGDEINHDIAAKQP